MKNYPGANQVPGATPCLDPFHYCYPDMDLHGRYHELPKDGDECPTCGAVSYGAGVRTKAFVAEYENRLATSVCLTNSGGRFLCSRKVPAKVRAAGCCICLPCQNKEARREGRADGRAYSRTVERDHR